MKQIVLVLFLLGCIKCYTQSNHQKIEIQKFFEKEYQKEEYEKYTSEIKVVDQSKFVYENKTFNVYGLDEVLKRIFTEGILYPQLLSGLTSEPRISDEEFEKMSFKEQFFYELNRGDHYTITDIKELDFVSDSPKFKRFQFWLFRPKMANPETYFFELTNKNAHKETSFEEFIKNAQLSFFKYAWSNI